jgi:hypothetical protein
VRYPGRLALVIAAVAVALVACGSDRSGGPKGDASAIVDRAPDRTIAERSARVQAATPAGSADGTVDFATGRTDVTIRPESAAVPALRDPLVALDVVRAVASVTPYGGAEVRGASTIKYELDIAPPPDLIAKLGRGPKSGTFYADVFIDAQYRIRRVAFPLDPDEKRPTRDNVILAKLVTIDFYDFGVRPAT